MNLFSFLPSLPQLSLSLQIYGILLMSVVLYHRCKTAEAPDKPQSTKFEILVSANPPSIKSRTIQERALCLSCYISISVKEGNYFSASSSLMLSSDFLPPAYPPALSCDDIYGLCSLRGASRLEPLGGNYSSYCLSVPLLYCTQAAM